MNDLKVDVDNHKDMLKQSEGKRDELQGHMKETSENIKKDTAEHKAYQSDLLAEIQNLKDEIQRMKDAQAVREKEHGQEVEKLNQEREGVIESNNKKEAEMKASFNKERE